MASTLSFQGISSGLKTDQLVNALMEQASQPLFRFQDRQSLNNQRISAYQGLGRALNDLASAFTSLANTGLKTQTLTSSDSTGTFVTASASGAAAGAYDVQVQKIATKASQTFTPANTVLATDDLGGSPPYTLTLNVTRPSGVTTTQVNIAAGSSTLNGIRDAINNSAAGVTATLVQTSSTSSTPGYKLVLTTKDSGAGSVALTGGPAALGSNTTSDGQDAVFKVNGLQVTRSSNTVTDVASGVTFTLKSGSSDGIAFSASTILTVAQDKTAATNAFQNVVSKFNGALKLVKDGSNPGGAFANDSFARALVSKVRAAFSGTPTGLSSSNTYQSLSDLGLKTNQDGTLSLDTLKFQAALDKDPGAVANVFGTLDSSAGVVKQVQSIVDTVAAPGTGQIFGVTQRITGDNARLARLINQQQVQLDRKRRTLQDQFAQLESTIGQLQGAGQSLGAIR